MGLLRLIERPTDRSWGPGDALRVTPDGGREDASLFPLVQEVTVIGRSEYADVDLLLVYTPVNKRHVTIQKRPDGYYLEDLHSRNNTILNGEVLVGGLPRKLADGDRIRITGYLFEFCNTGSRGFFLTLGPRRETLVPLWLPGMV
jgi:pSer/pThr/pTyr-binding forkhead associated (FHA) protein